MQQKPTYEELEKRVQKLEQVENALQKSEERFSLAMEASKDGIWDWNLTTGDIYCSPGLTSMLGYNATDVVKNVDDWQELIHPDDKQVAYQANFDCVNNFTDSFEVEYRMKTKDGGLKWILGRGQAVYRDEHGKAVRIIGTHQDITKRKKAENDLYQKTLLLERVMDNLFDMVSLTDLEGRYTFAAKSHELILGYSIDELIGQNVMDFVHPDDFPHIMERFIALSKKAGKDRVEYRYRHKDGHYLWFETVGELLLNEKGEPKEFIFSTRDITERKQMEKKLLHNKKAESLSRMAGSVAHHFNNILMITMGNLELVREDLPSDHPVMENINEAERSARRAASLSQLMLTYIGQDARKNHQCVEITELCRSRILHLTKNSSQKVKINIEIESNSLLVMADGLQIMRVLDIILKNALEALEEKNIRELSIITKKVLASEIKGDYIFPVDFQPSEASYASISIVDTGKGIEDDKIELIFDPFYSEKFTGRGLGLAVALGIVRAHNGCITLESIVGKRTCFTVFLPMWLE
ncbi:putative Histidine kinase [Desulfamplus magnetovallimortis]|uniref:histidine kinase n=1 Tax=Desulfamplus magnetovallimortis TaxID=1246637 RepID=A0A1W1HF30_9BACT|nr:PAS domain-containing sensor histidine kinase [Desulfamplus magnetovallimortis]SLM31097.1 putative Histidine kinase [Desulfamplus magnetovallimortis]